MTRAANDLLRCLYCAWTVTPWYKDDRGNRRTNHASLLTHQREAHPAEVAARQASMNGPRRGETTSPRSP